MPVATILVNLEAGADIDDILAWFDGLKSDRVVAVIGFAARSQDPAAYTAMLVLLIGTYSRLFQGQHRFPQRGKTKC